MQFVFQAEVRRLLDHFSVLFNSRIILLSADGSVLYSGSGQSNCAFCKVVQNQLGLLETCRNWDREMQARSAREKTSLMYCCHAGLYEIIHPVFVQNNLFGYVMMGQFRAQAAPTASVRKIARQRGAEQDLDSAFESVQAYPTEKIEHIKQLLDAIVDYIIQCEYVIKTGRGEFETLIGYFQTNPESWMTVDEAARMIGRSPSYVAHRFREQYGCGLRHYQIQLKLNHAEQLLLHSTALPIKEIANRTGFDDPLYFSRLYKKHKGNSPSVTRSNTKT